MNVRRYRRTFASAVTVLLVAGTAHAQDREQDAERLFQEGQKLLAERRYGEACPKLEQAYKKDLQLGTLLNLAYCHKEQGAIWQAWLEFREAEIKASELKMKERKDFATKSKNELEKGLAKMIVDVPSKIELTEVLVEERRVPEAEKGIVFSVEPNGQRKFTFRAKGKKQATSLVVVSKSDKPQHVAVPEMEEETAASSAAAAPAPSTSSDGPPPAAAQQPQPPSGEKAAGGSQKILAYGLFGLAAVGVGIGAVTGLKTIQSPCSKDRSQCTQEEYDAASTSGVVSTISFTVAATALAAGLFLFLTAPKGDASASRDRRERARVQPVMDAHASGGWAGVQGRF
jgi:hypothetical protein